MLQRTDSTKSQRSNNVYKSLKKRHVKLKLEEEESVGFFWGVEELMHEIQFKCTCKVAIWWGLY